MTNSILLVGGNGLVGKKIVKVLIKNGIKQIKVTTRDPSKRDPEFDPLVQLVEFDFKKPETFKAACEGIEKLYLIIPPSDLHANKTIAPFLEYLKKETSIKKVLFLSGSTNDEGLPVIPSEKLIEQLGLEYVILEPTSFIDNFATFMLQGIKGGFILNPAADGKTGFISTNDIADVAGILLSNDTLWNKYKNKVTKLSGPESVTFKQVIELFNKHLNKQITIKDLTLQEYEEALKGYKVPADEAKFAALIYGCIRNGNVDYVDNNVEEITGHKPQSQEEYIISNLSIWQ